MALPHEILGVARGASFEEIRTAYKRLAMRWHPDRPNGDAEQFQRINQAFETIQRNHTSRGLFDDIFDDAARQHRAG